MINLTELLLKSAPTRNRLAFGINSNVVVKSCSNEVKRDKDNVIIERNAFIVLAKIDPETLEILAESEMSYFNLTHAGMAYDNFFHQLNQLPYITAAFLPQKKHIERFEHMLNKFKFKHLELNNKLIATADIAKEKWKKTSVSTDASTAEIAAMTGMLKELTDMCFSVLNMFSGVKRTGKAVGILADVMLVCTKKSSFLNFPKTA
ncbi:MAG: hypothetical protein KAH32_01755, partial [Chlamydiia bacterium]|nr:hypothetical protein [Chlamydiia bacterium]